MMSKFFVSRDAIGEGSVRVTGEDVNHIKNVLRAAIGDEITVCDGQGFDYACVIAGIGKSEITASYDVADDAVACDTEPSCRVTLYQGIAKGERMDQLIQKCVELGVYQIVPVVCARTVVRFSNDKDRVSKQERWQRIATEAAKQCNRGIIPSVATPVDFKEVVAQPMEGVKFIPYEEERTVMIKDVLAGSAVAHAYGEVNFFIGPEGGFDCDEVKLAVVNGFTPVSLGKRILRTETAGPAVMAVIGYELGF